jgi:dTDP-4-amino-4,6-dideoxygalactose transaminase
VTAHDTIITTPNTFASTVTAGMIYGAKPIFIDIDRRTGNLDLDQLAFNIKEHQSTRGRLIIMPVHYSGIPVDMEHLDRLIQTPDAIVIEDASHAIGSKYLDGKKVGCCAWSQMTMFSLHPAKTITTGEGGVVTTNDPELYERLKKFRNNGIVRDASKFQADPSVIYDGYYEVTEMTGNYNFTDFQAALGLSQLKRIDQFVEKRRELVQAYRRSFGDTLYIKLLTKKMDDLVAFHIFVAQIDFAAFNTTKAFVINALKEKGIGSQVHYIPVYKHPFFLKQSADISEYFPNMESYSMILK